MMAVEDHRQERRAELRAPMSLLGAIDTPAGECPVIVTDLSALGARVQLDDPPDPAHEYTLHFSVHQRQYNTRLRIVYWMNNDGSYHWGCAFLDLGADELDSLRRTVHAAIGLAAAFIRDWDEIHRESSRHPEVQVLVGRTPSGQGICLAAADCMELGQDGVGLFVRTVASLENA